MVLGWQRPGRVGSRRILLIWKPFGLPFFVYREPIKSNSYIKEYCFILENRTSIYKLYAVYFKSVVSFFYIKILCHSVYVSVYKEQKTEAGKILRKLCEWKGVNIVEVKFHPDYVHMLIEIPAKLTVSSFKGYWAKAV